MLGHTVNPFVSKISKQSWVLPVSMMCMVLGFMISMAWLSKTTRSSRSSYLSTDQRIRVNEGAVDIAAFEKLSNEVKALQAQNTKDENALASKTDVGKTLNDALQSVKAFAGLTAVIGPGLKVTLRDSPKETTATSMTVGVSPDYIIHDVDVLKVVNELVASGAEAVSVNDKRVAGNTSFRCVGTTILVNDVKIASPVVIRAIGDSSTLMGAMNMPGGVLAEIRQTDPRMVQVEAVKSQELPEFVGTTTRKFAKPIKDAK